MTAIVIALRKGILADDLKGMVGAAASALEAAAELDGGRAQQAPPLELEMVQEVCCPPLSQQQTLSCPQRIRLLCRSICCAGQSKMLDPYPGNGVTLAKVKSKAQNLLHCDWTWHRRPSQLPQVPGLVHVELLVLDLDMNLNALVQTCLADWQCTRMTDHCADAFGSCRAAKGSQAEAAQRTPLEKGAGACLSRSA